MTDPEGTAAKRRVDVAFLQCCDATVFAEPVLLTDTEEQRLRALLASLQDFGLILRPNAAARRQHYDFDALLGHLRASVGAPVVEAALAADPDAPLSREPAPVAVMPVWAFEPEGDDPEDQDVLLSSGRLWGTDVLIEALRVESEESPAPVPTVRSRFERWLEAGGGGRDRAVVRLPGRDGCYVLFAAAAPA
jgi:hypothetical protein